MAATVIKAVVERTPGLDPETIDDVVLGCAMPEAEQGLNVARIATLRAGLSHKVPAQTVNRFCSSGLQTIAQGAQQIMTGMADVSDRRRHRKHEHGADVGQRLCAEPDTGRAFIPRSISAWA